MLDADQKDDAKLEEVFLTEFGDKGDKLWDCVKELTNMTQASLATKDFVRNVLVKACRVYGVEAYTKLEKAQQMEVMAILMNGFNTTVKTLMLLWNIKDIPQIIACAQEAKSVEESSLSQRRGSKLYNASYG